MTHALFFLGYRSLCGRIVRWLRLMRQPKYLVGTLIGVAWLTFWALRPLLRATTRGLRVQAEALEQAAAFLPTIHLSVALLIAVTLSIWWLVPVGKSVLALSEAELHVLLPAPVPRRHIIQYAILKHQRGILFGCLILSIFTAARSGGEFGWRLLTMWMFLSIWDLHSKGRRLWLAQQRELSAAAAWRRRVLLVIGIVAFWLAVAPGLMRLAAAIVGAPPEAVVDRLAVTLGADNLWAEARLVSIGLTPFLWLTEPFFAGLSPEVGLTGRLASLGFPAVCLVLHNGWVARSQAQFEEVSLARSRRDAASRDPAARFGRISRSRRLAVPFRLDPRGRPEVAIVWKNLMLAHRTRLVTVTLSGLAALTVASTIVATTTVPAFVLVMLMVAGFVTLVFTPLMAGHQWRNDLRSDLLRVEHLRTWPLAGWKLFAAEVLAPAIVATLYGAAGAGMLLVVSIATTLDPSGSGATVVLFPRTLGASLGVPQLLVTPLALCGALPLMAGIACLSATLQNLWTLVFPSWAQLGLKTRGSTAHIGQGLLAAAGLFLALAVSLLPGVLLVTLGLVLQVGVFGIPLSGWQLPVIGLLVALPLFGIAALLVRLGGTLWDRLDPSREILSGAA